MGSPHGVKEVLSPVAALAYLDMFRHDHEIMLNSLYRGYLRLRTS